MTRAELDQVWYTVTFALESEFHQRGWLAPGRGSDEIKQLRAALTQFVACCDTAPPTSLMIELGLACTVARAALAQSSGVRASGGDHGVE